MSLLTLFHTSVAAPKKKLRPHLLVQQPPGTFKREVSATLAGAQVSAEGGNVIGDPGKERRYLSPLLLTQQPRNFESKGLNDVQVTLDGAQVNAKGEQLEGSSYEIGFDGAQVTTQAGTVTAQISEFRAAYYISLALATRSISLDQKERQSTVLTSGADRVTILDIVAAKRTTDVSLDSRHLTINGTTRTTSIQHDS